MANAVTPRRAKSLPLAFLCLVWLIAMPGCARGQKRTAGNEGTSNPIPTTSGSGTGIGSTPGSGTEGKAGVIIKLPEELHAAPIFGLASDPNYLVVTCGGCGSVFIFDSASGTLTKQFALSVGAHAGLAVSKDGRAAVGLNVTSGNGPTLAVIDLKTLASPSLVLTQGAAAAAISAVAFKDDGSALVLGDGTDFLLLGGGDYTLLKAIGSGRSSAITDVAVSPDGLRVVAGSASPPNYEVFTTTDWKSLATLDTNFSVTTGARRVTFSPDGTHFVIASGEQGRPEIWDTLTGDHLSEAAACAVPVYGAAYYTNDVVLCAEGDRVTTAKAADSGFHASAGQTGLPAEDGLLTDPARKYAAVYSAADATIAILTLQ